MNCYMCIGCGSAQVQNRAGEWIDADPRPDAFVVNIGDMVAKWTHGLYPATLHRVVNRSPRYRVSIPFFYEPNFDALVQPLPLPPDVVSIATGVTPLSVRQGEPVMYGHHLLQKVSNNFVFEQPGKL